MKKYNLIMDEKITGWIRTRATIEADSQDEAIEKLLDGDYSTDEAELLWDTIEGIYPEDNNGDATIEIFGDSCNSIYDNSEKSK